jgi:hypothetical protein
MIFKTHHGAVQRALFESSFSRTHVWRVVANTNSTQVAQGFTWRLKKQRRKAPLATA